MQLIFALLLISIISALAMKQSRIRKGHIAQNMPQLPWMAYVLTKTKNAMSICSGSILDKQHVLTAAHCLCPRNVTEITVVTGTLDVNRGFKAKYSVRSSRIHPRIPRHICFNIFPNRDEPYDVAMLTTTNNIEFSDTVQPIDVNYQMIHDGIAVMQTGYGFDERKKYGRLKYAFSNARKCFHSLICIENADGYPYNGDSGAPLVVCRGMFQGCRQIGIMSGGINYTDVFASTHFLKNFIERSLQDKNMRSKVAPSSAGNSAFTFGLVCLSLMFILW